jgi:MoaA/NifB/PqqE/SkfB family radical SAM enzyme
MASRAAQVLEFPRFLYYFAHLFFRVPDHPGATVTWKRLWNLYKLRWASNRVWSRLRSYPAKLTIEPTTACNLRCPACFTGTGEVGRKGSPLSLDAYRTLLAELGDYLCQIELCNWGEPLLAKHLYAMIEEAHARGIETLISTNFSIPFDDERAERLVRSGLSVLGVSIDGARQETYAAYRVGGNLDLVFANLRRVVDAKRRLGASTPRIVWEFHLFPHNVGDLETARAMAAELGVEFAASKGWVIGADWDPEGRHAPPEMIAPLPCTFLWHTAVVNNDGGVSPCCGTFYEADDMGRLAPDGSGFGAIWNGPRFQAARRLFRTAATAPEARDLICADCPVTVEWRRWRQHIAAGGMRTVFRPTIGGNERYNYFWDRRPKRAGASPRAGRRVPVAGGAA